MLANFPHEKNEISRSYAMNVGQHLQVGVKVDAGADTNVAVTITVEV